MNSTLALFEAIAAAGKISRSELSRITGFSLMTVGKAVDRLVSLGIVAEEKISSGTVGRKFGVCSLTATAGMMLIEVGENMRAYALDIALGVISEHVGDDIPTLMTKCFTSLFEAGRGDIIGTVFVVPDGEITKWRGELCEMLGSEPELVIGRERAFAYANSVRFDYTKTAIFAHVASDGKVSGFIMQNGAEYVGARGVAGDISAFIPSADSLCERLTELCRLLDPELVHVACDNGEMCASLEADLKKLDIFDDGIPQIVVERTDSCKAAFDGAARKLREKYILSKFPNNT